MRKNLKEEMSIKECGIERDEYFSAIKKLSLEAFDDQCTSVNPNIFAISQYFLSDINDLYLGNAVNLLGMCELYSMT